MKSIHDFKTFKQESRKISMITCYDACFGKIVDKSSIDAVLVGDSVAMVLHGYDSTLHATPEMMQAHTSAVARSVKNKFIVADMPFLSFRKGKTEALDVAGSLMKSGAHAVKIEGLKGHEDVIEHLIDSGIPVMGHLGLTPQSVMQLGGHRIQGRIEAEAHKIINEASELERLGCFALVLECVPEKLGTQVTQKLSIPTIGIGAGRFVDGQVLVLHDMLGAQPEFKPKFLKSYAQLHDFSLAALNNFDEEVKKSVFPSEKEIYI
jgi:3-methyl-2-oxobutanoate hydroxymethyltransferase